MPDRTVGQSDDYKHRCTDIFNIVQEASVRGITCAALVEFVPWEADSDEIRGKLMSLRSRGCVRLDDGRWYA
jgi:hypothetical protein